MYLIKYSTLCLAVSAFCVFTNAVEDVENPVVSTNAGKLKGSIEKSRQGRTYFAFKNITYGKVTERFQNAEKPDEWTGVIDATEYGPRCVQLNSFFEKVLGEEDCLNLNVFTPLMNKDGDHKVMLPVMVYFHWGYHTFGGVEQLGPQHFMDKDVILVTLNFRLGPFGFLNLGMKEAAGNMGLKDQVLALKWVQENIENFGGDKDRVTIYGQDSGANDVVYHMLSPMSKGLFHQGISESHSAQVPFSVIHRPLEGAKKLGEIVGCPTDDKKALLECLKTMDAKEMLKKIPFLKIGDPLNLDNQPKIGVTVEKVLEGEDESEHFLTGLPREKIYEGKFSQVPIILGFNNLDGINFWSGALMNDTDSVQKILDEFETVIPKYLHFDKTAKDPKALAKKIFDKYLKTTELNEDTREKLVEIFTDRFYTIQSINMANAVKKSLPVYFYNFNKMSKKSFANVYNFNWTNGFKQPGAMNGDEVPYFYHIGYNYENIEKEDEEYDLSNAMVDLWTSFAETGKPTTKWEKAEKWEKLEGEGPFKFLSIGNEMKLYEIPKPWEDRINFWRDILDNELESERHYDFQ